MECNTHFVTKNKIKSVFVFDFVILLTPHKLFRMQPLEKVILRLAEGLLRARPVGGGGGDAGGGHRARLVQPATDARLSVC